MSQTYARQSMGQLKMEARKEISRVAPGLENEIMKTIDFSLLKAYRKSTIEGIVTIIINKSYIWEKCKAMCADMDSEYKEEVSKNISRRVNILK